MLLATQQWWVPGEVQKIVRLKAAEWSILPWELDGLKCALKTPGM